MKFIVFPMIFFISMLVPATGIATFDIRISGGVNMGVGKNSDSLPKKDGDESESFTGTGYSLDLMFSDYWLIFGARAEEMASHTGSFFYFDTTANQYTKYGVKMKSRAYSGIVGFHYELNRQDEGNNGQKSLYSASILGVIPFDQSNEIEVESANALGQTQLRGVGNDVKMWSVYLEANRAAPGGFVVGMQLGYKHFKVENILDSSDSPLSDYQGNPLEVDLSHIDFRLFFGIRF